MTVKRDAETSCQGSEIVKSLTESDRENNIQRASDVAKSGWYYMRQPAITAAQHLIVFDNYDRAARIRPSKSRK